MNTFAGLLQLERALFNMRDNGKGLYPQGIRPNLVELGLLDSRIDEIMAPLDKIEEMDAGGLAQLAHDVGDAAVRAGTLDKDKRLHEQVPARIEEMYRVLMGMPAYTGERSILAHTARETENLATYAIAGVFGLSGTAEIANVIAQTGWRASLETVPGLSQMVNLMTTGQLKNAEYLYELMNITGVGTEITLFDQLHRYTPEDQFVDRFGRLGQAITGITTDLKGVATGSIGVGPVRNIFGSAPADHVMRVAALKGAVRHLINLAYKYEISSDGTWVWKHTEHTKWSKDLMDALSDYGLGQEEIILIGEQIREHGVVKPLWLSGDSSPLSKELVEMDWNAWNPEALMIFANATRGWVDNMVIKGRYGEMPQILNHPLMRPFFQFQSFSFAGAKKLGKHFLRHTFKPMLKGGKTETPKLSAELPGDNTNFRGRQLHASMYVLATAVLVEMARTYIKADEKMRDGTIPEGRTDVRDAWIESQNSWSELIPRALSRHTGLGLVLDGWDAAITQLSESIPMDPEILSTLQFRDSPESLVGYLIPTGAEETLDTIGGFFQLGGGIVTRDPNLISKGIENLNLDMNIPWVRAFYRKFAEDSGEAIVDWIENN